jgi:hypothetical protein
MIDNGLCLISCTCLQSLNKKYWKNQRLALTWFLAPSKQREIWERWLVSFFKHYKVMIFTQCLLTVKSHLALDKGFCIYFNPYSIYGYFSVLTRSLIYFEFLDVNVFSWSWWCVPCFEQQRETWLITGSGNQKLHYSCLSISLLWIRFLLN